MDNKAKEIKLVAIEEIVANPKNANKHSPEQIERLKKIISYQGFREPLVISTRSGFLVCGHGRLEAAKSLGVKELPCIYQDFKDEAQEYAHMVADNEIARWANLDEEKLKNDLKDFKLEDLDVLGLLDTKFLDEITPTKIDEEKEDDVPEVKDVITKKGDVWVLGNHRLMCGDSTMIDDVEKLLPEKKENKKIHFISDPPYGLSYQSSKRTDTEKFDVLKNDDTILDFIPLVDQLTNGFFYIWTSYQVVEKWILKVKEHYPKLTNMIIWFKGGGGIGDLKGALSTDYEIGLVVNRGNEIVGKRVGSVWEVGRENGTKFKHPTQKPVEINEKVLEHFTNKDDIVLDLFGGSGSNLIACEKMGRICRMMELDEKYCDVIINRWQNLTGKKAKLESTGEEYDSLVSKPQV